MIEFSIRFITKVARQQGPALTSNRGSEDFARLNECERPISRHETRIPQRVSHHSFVCLVFQLGRFSQVKYSRESTVWSNSNTWLRKYWLMGTEQWHKSDPGVSNVHNRHPIS